MELLQVPKFVVIEAPSILGLKPTGVERLPDALKAANLLGELGAEHAGRVEAPPYSPERDKTTLLLNPQAIHSYSLRLADAVASALQKNQFPLVLGGDCSILIGNALALRRLGKYGLFFIDGHADFYQPEASPTGEVADMDLAIVSGRGPDVLTNIDGLKPLVQDRNIVLFGYRDTKEAAGYGSQDVRESDIYVLDFIEVRKSGVAKAASNALDRLLLCKELKGIWVHLDVDVLDDAVMPAVDYRMKDGGGLNFTELGEILKVLFKSGRVVGMDITIFNPNLDRDGSIARKLVSSIVTGLSS
ncbi:arginase family hydrolase, arginase/agmainase/formiminoglutamate hydrolase [Candidatus Nitrososphaera evergladensis SR1]|uniref:Arginase family hydrolase, arginase/agmainase/formiminoglutamate hydrolase n=1 Tax=Candidatus Nitrososphaera evergladensis SR1 TaxID=1459636 RepID=A0A075MQ91_9ARCH|nr:arginase family hydrolase, arginase/agmainase/formiminoglutamate hydrolase [Candidatus Nitrososphaera evergladensis SR1]